MKLISVKKSDAKEEAQKWIDEKHTEPDTHQVNLHQQIQQIRSAIIYYGVIVEVETQI